MAAQPENHPLLATGNEAEWARINEEKRQALTPPSDMPIAELLRRGQRLLVPDDTDNDRRILAALRKLDGVRFRDDEPLRSEHLSVRRIFGQGRALG